MKTIIINSKMKNTLDTGQQKKLNKHFKKYIDNNIICFSVDIKQKYNENLKEWKKDIIWSKWKDITLETTHINENYNGIGLLTGKKNNMIVIDIDNKENWYKLLDDNERKEPNTIKVNSGNGGFHLYFNYDEELNYSTTNIFGDNYNGVDIRSDGGCIFAPPTMYFNKNLDKNVSYEWDNKKDIIKYEMSDIPKWLKKIILENKIDDKKIIDKKIDDKKIIDKKINDEQNENIIILNNDEEKNICKEMLNELSLKTCTDNKSWLDIIMTLHNITNGCPILAREWSKKADNYDEKVFTKRYNSFKKGTKNMGTLLYYLKKDTSPEKYIELRNKMYIAMKRDKVNIKKDYTLEKIFYDGNIYDCEKITTKYLIEKNDDEIKIIKNVNSDQDKTNNIIYNWINKDVHSLILSSAYNTGKTTLIKRLLPHFKSILFISCRIALSNDIYGNFKKLGFEHYKKTQDLLCDRLIIQYESLQKIINTSYNSNESLKKYDLIIIDESESILNYADANHQKTIYTNFENLRKFVKLTPKCLYMDGDITNRTLNFSNETSNKSLIYVKNEFSHKKSLKIIENVKLFNNELYDDLNNKKRLLICSLSKTKAENYEKNIKEKYPQLKILLLTGKTDSKIKDINTENPNIEWIKYDVVIITTAVDIGVSFDVKEHFYKAYGILASGCATPRSFLQMTARVRNFMNDEITILNDVNVFKNNDDGIIPFWTFKEVLENVKLILRDVKIDDDGNYIYDVKNLYTTNYIFNHMEKLNSTPYYFIPYLKLLCDNKKWNWEYIENTEKGGKTQAYINYNIKETYESDTITQDEFNILCDETKRGNITEKDRNEKDKYEFEIYKLGLSQEQYKQFNKQKIIYDDKEKTYICYENKKEINRWKKEDIEKEKNKLLDDKINDISKNKKKEKYEYNDPSILNNNALWIRLMYEQYFNKNIFNNFINIFDKSNYKKDVKEGLDNYLDDKKIDEFNKLLDILNINKKDLIHGVIVDNIQSIVLNNIKQLDLINGKLYNDKKYELDKVISKKSDKDKQITKLLQNLFTKYGFELLSKRIRKQENKNIVSIQQYFITPSKEIINILMNELRFNSEHRKIQDTTGIFLPFKTDLLNTDIFDIFDVKK